MNVIQRIFMKTAAKGFRPTIKQDYAVIGGLCMAFYKKYGKEAIPIITEVMGKSGVAQAAITQKVMPVKDMKGLAELYKMLDSMMDFGMELIEVTDDKIHFKASECSLGLGGTSKELCEAMMASDKNFTSTLLGQEVEVKVIKSIAAGDKECEVIYSKKVKGK
jgi:predicted hydrocarbon binding protein